MAEQSYEGCCRDLVDQLRRLCPSCSAAFLVGSAARRRGGGPVADIDIIGLDLSVPPDRECSINFMASGLPAHAMIYHPQSLAMVLDDEQLTFAFLRELRKIHTGIVLFDDSGIAQDIRARLRLLRVPPKFIKPFAEAARSFLKVSPKMSQAARLLFYHSIENLTFGWLNSSLDTPYSKPKWVLADSRSLSTSALSRLLERTALDLVSKFNLAILAAELDEQIHFQTTDLSASLYMGVAFHLNDAKSLISSGLILEAVYPLRMACYQHAEAWASRLRVEYKGIPSILNVIDVLQAEHKFVRDWIEHVLLLNDALSDDLISLYRVAVDEFSTIVRIGD